jgi:hypothetical protein
MNRRRWVMAWVLAQVCLALACGDDESNAAGSGGDGGAGGVPDASSAGGTGGTGGDPTGGTGGAATGGTGGDGERVICGGVGGFICTESKEVMGMTLGPCCDTDSGNICGVGKGGQCEGLYQAGAEAAECPTEKSITGHDIPGCCRTDGKCGLWFPADFGCVERGDVTELGIGPFDAMSCTAPVLDDAGAA